MSEVTPYRISELPPWISKRIPSNIPLIKKAMRLGFQGGIPPQVPLKGVPSRVPSILPVLGMGWSWAALSGEVLPLLLPCYACEVVLCL